MLFVFKGIQHFGKAKEWYIANSDKQIDLSKSPLSELANNSELIVSHHPPDTVIFLGYLEGWLLEPIHTTIIRKLIRKFKVVLVLQFPESLPFSWKNDIDTIFV